MKTERNLLLGILALQNSFITREQLVAAIDRWLIDKSQSLGEILQAAGHLAVGRRTLLERLTEEHLGSDGPNPFGSASFLFSSSPVFEDLLRSPDPDIQSTLIHLSTVLKDNPASTVIRRVGTSTSSGNRFRVLRLHDSGGLGNVYIANDEELSREVALKEIKNEYADHPDFRARFLLEAEITGGLEHPGIVPVYGLGAYENGRPFYAMRFIKGDSLGKAIKEFHQADGPDRDSAERSLSFRRLLNRFIDVCDAIEYAHSRGIIHRDLKPGNIMLGSYGETLVVDWGLAKVLGRKDQYAPGHERTLRPPANKDVVATEPGTAVGTLPFMSPEQAEGRLADLMPASDVYSLGATLYTVLTGELAFDDSDSEVVKRRVVAGDFAPPKTKKESVPLGLEKVCLKAMAFDPADRYESARLLAEAIEQWLADEPLQAYRREVEEKRVLVEAHPDDPTCRKGLARARANLGIILLASGRAQQAVESLRLAIQDFLQLIFEEPTIVSNREGFADANIHLRRALRTLGQNTGAREAHIAALEEYKKLAEINPHAELYRVMEADLTQTLATFAPSDDAEPGAFTPPMRGVGVESDASAQYVLDRPFSSGAFAEVWLAWDRTMRRKVLLKKLREGDDADLLAAEARTIARLSHPSIVTVLDIGRLPDDTFFFTMPMIQADTLRARLTTGIDRTSRLNAHVMLNWFIRVCEAVAYAHESGVMHGDVKPDNILIGDFGVVVLIDWGLARWFKQPTNGMLNSNGEHETDLTSARFQEGTVAGTPAYMSPEQASGNQNLIGPASDIYSLGATLFEYLTGQRVFGEVQDIHQFLERIVDPHARAPRARAINSSIPRELDAICAKALEKRPEDRYSSAPEMLQDLQRWMVGEAPEAYTARTSDRIRYWCRRKIDP